MCYIQTRSLICETYPPQSVALGWRMVAPSGRERLATSRLVRWADVAFGKRSWRETRRQPCVLLYERQKP